MKLSHTWLWLLLLPCAAQLPVPVPVEGPPVAREWRDLPSPGREQTLSRSEQFRVRGADVRIRGTVSFLAEQAKTDILNLTKEKDEWKVPITILLHGKQGDPIPRRTIALDLAFGEDGFTLTVHAHLAQGVDEEKFRSAVIAALVYERSLRNMKPGPLDDKLLVRPWLVEGISEMLDWKSGKRDRRLYQAVYQAGGIYDSDELLATAQAEYDLYDGAMRSTFRVSAGSLMMALLEQPQGHTGFRAFLAEAAQFGGDMPVLLRKHFPELNLSNKSLEKWWALQMANMSRNSLHDVMSIADTERALDQALKLQILDENNKSTAHELDAWQKVIDLPDGHRAFAVRHAQEDLIRLSYRCFPSYRELLVEYQSALQTMVTKKNVDKLREKINDLEERRIRMQQNMKRASDYLDWFEITRARETTGVFDDYIKLKQRLDQGLRMNEDHISRYLDKVEALYRR